MPKKESLRNGNTLTSLESYLYNECRIVLLHIIGNDFRKFGYKYGINYTSLYNFIKWDYSDYLTHSTDKKLRYLSTDNCIRILELSGYEIRLSLVLKNDTENEV